MGNHLSYPGENQEQLLDFKQDNEMASPHLWGHHRL